TTRQAQEDTDCLERMNSLRRAHFERGPCKLRRIRRRESDERLLAEKRLRRFRERIAQLAHERHATLLYGNGEGIGTEGRIEPRAFAFEVRNGRVGQLGAKLGISPFQRDQREKRLSERLQLRRFLGM